ncbi:uncharacterized protein K02A2.6-like [Ornithodoros turicata]|uniref:uncharacterized protein K02A2.6-like n=1 Tax=Ornithodoros turicata TaxID=34597 RepID=UPI003139AA7B
MDTDIEHLVRCCEACQLHRRSPPPVPSPHWSRPTQPWHMLHVDLAGLVEGQMYLLVVDAFSKWLEARRVNKSTSPAVIQTLRNLFATFGAPQKVISDNGTAFTSRERRAFFKANGVTHFTSAPYHPATNGKVERMVAELISAPKRDRLGTTDRPITRFLFKQHITIDTTTRQTPAFLMSQRELPSPLSALRPSIQPPSPTQEEETSPSLPYS